MCQFNLFCKRCHALKYSMHLCVCDVHFLDTYFCNFSSLEEHTGNKSILKQSSLNLNNNLCPFKLVFLKISTTKILYILLYGWNYTSIYNEIEFYQLYAHIHTQIVIYSQWHGILKKVKFSYYYVQKLIMTVLTIICCNTSCKKISFCKEIAK